MDIRKKEKAGEGMERNIRKRNREIERKIFRLVNKERKNRGLKCRS